MKFLKQLIVFIIVIIALVIFIPRNNQTKTNKNLKEITSYYLTYNNVDIRINNNFQVETYYDGNVERIKSILFTGDNIYTNEGVGLGDPESYIVNTYNQATVYKDNVYQYILNDTRLSFIVSKGKIISIEYSMT